MTETSRASRTRKVGPSAGLGPSFSLSAVRRDSAARRADGLQEARTFTSGLRHLLVVLCEPPAIPVPATKVVRRISHGHLLSLVSVPTLGNQSPPAGRRLGYLRPPVGAPIGTDDQCQHDRSSIKLQVALAAKNRKERRIKCGKEVPVTRAGPGGFRRCIRRHERVHHDSNDAAAGDGHAHAQRPRPSKVPRARPVKKLRTPPHTATEGG